MRLTHHIEPPPAAMRLSPVLLQQMKSALLAAYTKGELEQLVQAVLNKSLAEISLAGNLDQVVFELLGWAAERSRLLALMEAAAAARGANPELAAALDRLRAEIGQTPGGDWPRLPFEPATVLAPAAAGHSLPAFRIGLLPVTCDEYAAYLAETPTQPEPSGLGWFVRRPPAGKGGHPVSGVSWHDAAAYCAWLARRCGRPYRLPGEAEWERAARGDDGRLYPWGSEWDAARAHTGSGTAPAGSLPAGAGPFGCLDLIGNVQEWTADLWDASDRRTHARRVHRGGGYADPPERLSATARANAPADSAVAWRGFRVMCEL